MWLGFEVLHVDILLLSGFLINGERMVVGMYFFPVVGLGLESRSSQSSITHIVVNNVVPD